MRASAYSGAGGNYLSYQCSGPPFRSIILLIHGFAGSSDYFQRNFDALVKEHSIVAPDLRGHGRLNSPNSARHHHAAVLAADQRCLVILLKERRAGEDPKQGPPTTIVPVGRPLGAAILWAYVEMFGCDDFAGFVFIDQAPLQAVSNLPLVEPWDQGARPLLLP